MRNYGQLNSPKDRAENNSSSESSATVEEEGSALNKDAPDGEILGDQSPKSVDVIIGEDEQDKQEPQSSDGPLIKSHSIIDHTANDTIANGGSNSPSSCASSPAESTTPETSIRKGTPDITSAKEIVDLEDSDDEEAPVPASNGQLDNMNLEMSDQEERATSGSNTSANDSDSSKDDAIMDDTGTEPVPRNDTDDARSKSPKVANDQLDATDAMQEVGEDNVDDELQTQRKELLDKFITHCGRIRGSDGIPSIDSYREKYRLTDLLKWFVDDNSRPFAVSSMAATREATGGGPLTFRKCLEKTGFQRPLSISLPPSQVVDLMVETAPEKSLRDHTKKAAGEVTTESMAHQRQFSHQPAPNMTRFLYDIGYGLVSEVAYRSVLNKAMNELSASSSTAGDSDAVERHAQMVEHVRRVYEDAKKQNQSFKMKAYRCPIEGCYFATETQLQMHEHRRKPHKQTHRWLCALCMKFSSWNDEDMEEHYNYEHGFTSAVKWDPSPSRAPCPLCDQEFQYKGHLKNHLRTPGECPVNSRNIKLTAGAETELEDVLNLYLWPKVEERRSIFGTSISRLQKPQERMQTLHLLAAKNDALRSPGINVRTHNGNRVADVVDLVAAGQGQIRPKSTTNISVGPNLPRILPVSASSAVRTTTQQQLVDRNLLSQFYVTQHQTRQRPAVLAQPSSSALAPRPQLRPSTGTTTAFVCEICDASCPKKLEYLKHLQVDHRKLLDKSEMDLAGAAPLACSRCRDRFYSYEGLERHLLMEHNLVTNELLSKAQKRQDSGKCRICTRIYAFNLLQHLVHDHGRTLCSAEIVYSCDVCYFQCNSYVQLELHLRNHHAEHGSTSGLRSPAPSQGGYTQASSALSLIAQRQQQSMLVLQQPPRSSSSQLPVRSSIGPQNATAVLSALGKRRLPSSSERKEPLERPPKLVRMNDGVQQGSNSNAARSTPDQERRHQVTNQTNRKQLRYCCTPCDLKFISYEAVLKHWVERHLKPVRVPLCRIDKCTVCQEKLTSATMKNDTGDDDLVILDESDEDTDHTNDATKRTGLILDLELPVMNEERVKKEDGDTEPSSRPASPTEVICLD